MTIVVRTLKSGKKSYGVKVWRHGREVWVGTRPSRPLAKALEREEEAREVGTSRERIADFVDRWPTDYARPSASTNARNRYQAAHLAREHGQLQLGELTRAQARVFARQRPWAAQVVRQLFADALADELVAFNPFDRITLPRGRGRADLDADHLPAIADVAELSGAAIAALGPYGAHFAAAMQVAFHAGLRAGELLALRLFDVDLERGILHVRHSLGPSGTLKAPKSGKARDVVLGPHAIGALIAAAATAPEPATPDDALFVFRGPRGARLTKSTHHRLWTRTRAAGPDRWRTMPWHLFRHACATHMLNVRRLAHDDVAQHLGHRDATLVLALYGHPSQRLAADRIRDALADPDW